MPSASEAKRPNVAELQRFTREKTELEFILSNGGREFGKLKWFDDDAFCLQQQSGSLTLLRSGVIGYRAK